MTVDVDVHLGRRLRLRRRLIGMTQQELADACGIRFQQVQKYECAANRMNASRLWELAVCLGVQPAYFFEGLGGNHEPRAFGVPSERFAHEAG